jgi:carboxymethylenebutenolidase
MIITKTFHDVPTKLDANGRPIRIFVISPVVPNYPHAKFPGVVCFRYVVELFQLGRSVRCRDYSEIYQVTGPVERFAGQIASQGYVVG